MQVITIYLPDFLHKQRGLSIERATIIGVIFGVATTVGQLAGAQLGQRLYNRRAKLQPLLMGVSESFLPFFRGGAFSILFVQGFRLGGEHTLPPFPSRSMLLCSEGCFGSRLAS